MVDRESRIKTGNNGEKAGERAATAPLRGAEQRGAIASLRRAGNPLLKANLQVGEALAGRAPAPLFHLALEEGLEVKVHRAVGTDRRVMTAFPGGGCHSKAPVPTETRHVGAGRDPRVPMAAGTDPPATSGTAAPIQGDAPSAPTVIADPPAPAQFLGEYFGLGLAKCPPAKQKSQEATNLSGNTHLHMLI